MHVVCLHVDDLSPRPVAAHSEGMDARLRFVRGLVEPLRVTPGTRVRLSHRDPGDTGDLQHSQAAAARLDEGISLLVDYQDRLAAQGTHAVLLVLQGLDGAGKDSTVKHVMSGVNPQGVEVHAFRQPTADEVDHDFLWRYQRDLPRRGRIGIFNRSHYEEVLVVRVHPELLETERLPPPDRRGDVWRRRFQDINDWERHLVENGTRVVKVLLNLSRAEQADRFLKRIDRPEKHWKFSAQDIRERRYWTEYQKAFEAMLTHTSTRWAPWYVVPADHKWFTRLATAAVLVNVLHDLDPQYPSVAPEVSREMAAARQELLAERH